MYCTCTKKLVPPSVCVYMCVYTHIHMYSIVLRKVHKQLKALTEFSTYLVHVPLVATTVGVGAYHGAHHIRRLDRFAQQFWPVRIDLKWVCRSSQFAGQVNWLEISSWQPRTDLRSVFDLQELTWYQFLIYILSLDQHWVNQLHVANNSICCTQSVANYVNQLQTI
jgi:hypothetical protein